MFLDSHVASNYGSNGTQRHSREPMVASLTRYWNVEVSTVPTAVDLYRSRLYRFCCVNNGTSLQEHSVRFSVHCPNFYQLHQSGPTFLFVFRPFRVEVVVIQVQRETDKVVLKLKMCQRDVWLYSYHCKCIQNFLSVSMQFECIKRYELLSDVLVDDLRLC